MLSKTVPCRLTLASEMKCSDNLRMSQQSLQRSADGEGTGRVAALIIYHLYYWSGTVGKFEHRMNKARASRTVKPRHTPDDMVRAKGSHRLFSGPFALSVNASTAGWDVIFGVRA